MVVRDCLGIRVILGSLDDFRNAVHSDMPNVFDTRDIGDLLATVARFDIHSGAVKDVVSSADVVVDASSPEDATVAFLMDVVVIFDDVCVGDDVGRALFDGMERACLNKRCGGEEREKCKELHV